MSNLNDLIELHKKKLHEAQQKGDTLAARKWARLLDVLLREPSKMPVRGYFPMKVIRNHPAFNTDPNPRTSLVKTVINAAPARVAMVQHRVHT